MGLYDPCHKAGGMTRHAFEIDPKRLGFILARYKFVAKMLEGKQCVLEVGCADGYGSRVVRQHVGSLDAIDIDEESIAEAIKGMSPKWPIGFSTSRLGEFGHDSYSAVYCLDVLEHVSDVNWFLHDLRHVAPICIIGSPSLESQQYASELSKQGHVSCMTGEQLKAACSRHWKTVFMFGMNDEVLHTGFGPMCQYRFALCVA